MKPGKSFGNLKIRYKLMVLHNLFFLVLAGSVWMMLIPLIEDGAAGARQAKITLALTLLVIYALAVLVLEMYLMRRYIYQPLRLLLHADKASRTGDTAGELIDEHHISADELGQVMRSRNETIRKLREHEHELEQALRRLETAKRNIADQDRLASLGLLSASVAHELNTPLAVLHGSIEKLLETATGEMTRERLERMLRVTRRLKKMSDDLTDYARVRRLEPAPVAVREVIEEAWNLVEIDEKAGAVEFSNRAGAGDQVLGNADRLVQLFVNLLRNAVNATPPGGHIQVETRHEEDGERAPAGSIVVTVADDGPGIPDDVLPQVFEAFVTTRLDARGTGLGLTVAEGIAHQHGGSITAANRASGGACLTVRLPAPG